MAVWTTANARAAMVGAVLVCWMLSRACWFQARTTLPPAAAPAGGTPAGAVSPMLKATSTTRMVASLRLSWRQPPQPHADRSARPSTQEQGEAVEPRHSSPILGRSKLGVPAATAYQVNRDTSERWEVSSPASA